MSVMPDEIILGEPILINVYLPPPIGGGGADAVIHDQTTPASEWIINHGFGRPPIVAIWIGGEEVLADLEIVSANVVRVEFPTPQVGKAVVS